MFRALIEPHGSYGTFQMQAVLESEGGAKKKPTFLRGGLL